MSLFTSPIMIKNLQLKNRLVMPPMATAKSSNGLVSEQLTAYYQEKAEGGHIGLVITEHSFISPEGKAHPGQLSIADDSDVPGLQTLTETIHSCGSPVFAQINHAGIAARDTGFPVYGPSAVRSPRARDAECPLPIAMSQADIQKVTADFASAAGRAKAAGYDGVEIHSAHGYLLNQFYSPLTNRRTDLYGGTAANRIRLHLEIIAAVREAVGADYPIALRLGACDYMEGGNGISEAVDAAIAFQQAGVDLLDISGGMNGYTRPDVTTPGYFRDVSAAIREKVSIPVLLTGGITDAAQAEMLLQAGAADLIGIGRAILKNSGWAKKAMEQG